MKLFLDISYMKQLDLFDDIEYKYIKNIIEDDEDYIEVEIEDLDCDRIACCKTRFIFELNDEKFIVDKEYNCSGAYALMMLDLDNTYEEEE